jgi:hypothetical protein
MGRGLVVKKKVWRKRGRTRLTQYVSVLMVQVVGVFTREAIDIVKCHHSFNFEEKYKSSTVCCWISGSRGCGREQFRFLG